MVWKATKIINRPQDRLRIKKQLWKGFNFHLEKVLQPNSTETNEDNQNEIMQLFQSSYQLELPLEHFTSQIARVMQLNPKKSPTFDLISV